jgi:hypothetical protein
MFSWIEEEHADFSHAVQIAMAKRLSSDCQRFWKIWQKKALSFAMAARAPELFNESIDNFVDDF